MPDSKEKKTKARISSERKDEMEELKIFIEKKKIQNVALKKIIAKLNTDDNSTSK